MGGDGPAARGVQSVARALELLEVMRDADEGLGVSGFASETGLPMATIHRLLATLVARGYARQDPQSRRYVLGWQALRFAQSADRALAMWVRPHLAELVELSGETANAAVLDDGFAVYVAQVPSRHKVRMFTEVGNRASAHTSAVGKVLLAGRPREFVEVVIARHGLPAHTPNSITGAGELFAELDRVARQGYAVDNEEEEVGVCCVAVPVRGPGGLEAALSVSGPAGRLGHRQRQRVVPEMQRVAAAVPTGAAETG